LLGWLLTRKVPCPQCAGRGFVGGPQFGPCPLCQKGVIAPDPDVIAEAFPMVNHEYRMSGIP